MPDDIDLIASMTPEDPNGPVSEDISDDLFDKAGAAYWFTANYHGGQASKLYELLSRNQFRPGPMVNGPEEDSAEEYYYQELEAMPIEQAEETIEQWLNEIDGYEEEPEEPLPPPGAQGMEPPVRPRRELPPHMSSIG